MTERDHPSKPSEYYPSAWPAECGGPRRQKVTRAPGLALESSERWSAQTRVLEGVRWPVMFVQRDPGELYLQGGTRLGQKIESYGWVEKRDPISLEPTRSSPRLPSGGHNWCGAVCVYENGDLYVVNGTYRHRLSPDLEVLAEHRLETENAHNGHVVLSDDPAKRAIFTVLDPQLRLVDRDECPWDSVGRFSADRSAGRDHPYVTRSTEIHPFVHAAGRLTLDPSSAARYALEGDDQGFAREGSFPA